MVARAEFPDAAPAPSEASNVGPLRTCVGCRKRDSATSLLRVVCQGGVLVPDLGKVLYGRGSSVHPRRHCFDAAVKRRAFVRALRLEHVLSIGEDFTRSVRNYLVEVDPEQADDTASRGAADEEGSRSDPS
ncbi:YlxR family protein [Nakamurella antarctica]|uniref:YlxR family protein n=1 Tax=Nakamurella antarctica TaxID=1902245 RepID=A0A3G8ZLJ8_9ACTN|nr:YlxR family protein [Nakamurella antarctica]AZI58090.1 YlxR family protein [Nakamurella antarctica]